VIDVELTVMQKKYYRALLEKNRKFLQQGMAAKHAPSLMNVLMQLRKLCNHPFLLEGVDEELLQNMELESKEEADAQSAIKEEEEKERIKEEEEKERTRTQQKRKKEVAEAAEKEKAVAEEGAKGKAAGKAAAENEEGGEKKGEETEGAGAGVGGQRKAVLGDPTRSLRDKMLIESSGKLLLLDKLLPHLKAKGSKVLLFSQMVRMLNLLAEFMVYKGYRFERLDGGVRGEMRQQAIDRFNGVRPKGAFSKQKVQKKLVAQAAGATAEDDMRPFVFLLSTRAGGLGLNLQTANTVIIFDSDWNPQNDLQAMARTHRIGQTQAVKVYRFVTRKTYESQLFMRATQKMGLDRALLGRFEEAGTAITANAGTKLGKLGKQSTAEIDSLLRGGAAELLQEDDTEAEASSRAYQELDIDKLLESTAREVKVDHTSGEEQADYASVFSKASFIPSDQQGGGKDQGRVDVTDPDFWKKVIPANATPLQKLMAQLTGKPALTGGKVAAVAADLNDPHPLSSAAARTHFAKVLRKVVEPVVQLRQEGEIPDNMEEVMQLLALVQTSEELKLAREKARKGAAGGAKMEGMGNEGMGYDVQAQAMDWARRIEKPTRRRKKVLSTIQVDEELQVY
jgi:chromodomain-helicase-DNA-binding protein 7